MSQPSEPTALDYGGYDKPRPLSRAALIGLIAGILSGPLSFMIAGFLARFARQNSGDNAVAIVLICHAAILLFCLNTFMRLRPPGGKRGRYLALGGIIATAVWATAITVFILFVLDRLD
jgi:hypothetical protein